MRRRVSTTFREREDPGLAPHRVSARYHVSLGSLWCEVGHMIVPACALQTTISILPVAKGTEPSSHHLVAILGGTVALRCFENTVCLITPK